MYSVSEASLNVTQPFSILVCDRQMLEDLCKHSLAEYLIKMEWKSVHITKFRSAPLIRCVRLIYLFPSTLHLPPPHTVTTCTWGLGKDAGCSFRGPLQGQRSSWCRWDAGRNLAHSSAERIPRNITARYHMK